MYNDSWIPGYTYIHGHRDSNHAQVKAKQARILGKAVRDKPRMHEMDKVEIKSCINKQEDDLLDSIPDFVDIDPGVIDLKSSWDPDCEDADVDAEDDNERPYL